MAHWLIVGPYPPEQGSGAAAAEAAVRERVAAGDTVHAVSPRPSAAHVHLPLEGLRGMRALARIARAQEADGLWLRVEPGILLRSGTDRRQALIERLALAWLLRRFDTSVLDVGDVGLLPGGRAGGPVFTAATVFVTHDPRTTATLVANGAPPDKLTELATSTSDRPADVAHQVVGPVDYPEPTMLLDLEGTRTAIETAISARAVELRSARAAAASVPPDR